MATVNLSFNVPTVHVAPLRQYLDSLHGEAIDGMTDVQAFEYHMVQATVPGYKSWRRAFDSPVATAKATLESNNAARASALAVDQTGLTSAQTSADAAGAGAMAGLS